MNRSTKQTFDLQKGVYTSNIDSFLRPNYDDPQYKQQSTLNTNNANATQNSENKKKQNLNYKKNWKSLNMRKPGGMTVTELQAHSKRGMLEPFKINKNYPQIYGFEEKFSEEEIQDFKEVFMFFDREGDGTMDIKDLGLALRAIGFLVTEQELKDLGVKLDPDKSNSIDINDFLSAISDVSNKEDSKDVLYQCFSELDKDRTGYIRIDELRHLYSAIGDGLTEEEFIKLLDDLDTKGENAIQIHDIVDLLSFTMNTEENMGTIYNNSNTGYSIKYK